MWNEVKDPEADLLDGEIVDVGALQVVASDVDTLTPLVRAAMAAGPRNHTALRREAAALGARMGRTAFYSFPAGGGQVEGATIKLAYALSALWGRMQTRAILVAKEGNRVTLRGIAIDLFNITSVERDHYFTLAPAPGKFARKPEQADRWAAMQLQAAMSKAVRSAILSCIPEDVVLAAVEAAQAAASSGLFRWLEVSNLREGVSACLVRAKQVGLSQDDAQVIADAPPDEWGMDELDKVAKVVKNIIDGVVPLARVKARVEQVKAEKAKAPAAPTAAPWSKPEEAQAAPTKADDAPAKPADKPAQAAAPKKAAAPPPPQPPADDDDDGSSLFGGE